MLNPPPVLTDEFYEALLDWYMEDPLEHVPFNGRAKYHPIEDEI